LNFNSKEKAGLQTERFSGGVEVGKDSILTARKRLALNQCVFLVMERWVRWTLWK
jgi:hypothetical protein